MTGVLTLDSDVENPLQDLEVDRLGATAGVTAKEVWRVADLVKFAAMEPSRGECDAHLAEARGFVERTRPTPAAGEASAAGGEE